MKKLLFLILLISITQALLAQATFTSISSGNWNGGLTVWAESVGDDADNIPDSDDIVIISTAHTINMNVNSACDDLTLNGTGNLFFNINNRTLAIGGDLLMNGNSQITGSNNNRVLNLAGNFLIPLGQIGSIGGIQFNQSASKTFTISGALILTANNGIKTVGNVIMNSASLWTATTNETVTTNDFTIFNGATIDAATNTAILNINGNLLVQPSTPGLRSNFGRMTMTVSGTTTVMANGYLLFSTSNGGNKTFNGTITNNLGGTWDNIVGEDPRINCSIVNNGVWPVPTGGNGRYDVIAGGSYTYSGTSEIGITRLRLQNGSTVTNNGTVRLTRTGGQNLSVESASTFINGPTGYLIFVGNGDVVDVTGAGSSVDFSAPTNTVEYSLGTGSQIVEATTYYNLKCLNGNTKTIDGTTTVNGTFSIDNSTLVDVTGGTDLLGMGNLAMTGTSTLRLSSAGIIPALTGSSQSLGIGTTIEFNRGGAQTAASSATYPYQNVLVSGGGGSALNFSNVTTILGDLTFTNQGSFNSNAVLTVAGNFNYTSNGSSTLANNITVSNLIFSNGTLNYSGRTITINGNDGTFTNNGGGGVLTTNASSQVIFTTGTNQQITGTTTTTFSNLTIDNINGVTLNGVNTTVSTGLAFTNGNLITGTNVLIMASSLSTITPTNGFVEGNLRKPVNLGNPSVTFEVGTGTDYAPVNIAFTNVTVAGSLTVASTAGDHPDINGSNIEPNRSVNRYWSFTNNATTFTSYQAVFNFAPGDLDGLADFSNFSVRRYDAINWASSTTGTRTATTTQITGETIANLPNGQLREYQIGELINTSGVFNRVTGTNNWNNLTTWIQNRTGTIQFTAASATVTGTGTLFLSELNDGDIIMLQTVPGTTYTVLNRADDVTLTLSANAPGTVSGGYGRQYIPNTINDAVTIGNSSIIPDATTTINLDMNATVNSLDINTTSSARATAQILTHSGTNSLTVQTNVRVNQPSGNTTDVWNINAGSATVGGNVTIGTAVDNANLLSRVNITTGTLTIGSNLIFNTSNNASRELTTVLNMSGGNGVVNLGGALTFINNRGLLLPGNSGSVFNLNRTSGAQNLALPANNAAGNPFTFHNLYLNNTSLNGVRLLSSLNATQLTGDLRVQSGLFRIQTQTIVGNGTRTFQVVPGATFRMFGNQGFPTGFGTFDLGTTSPFGTVEYATTNNQTISNHSYGNLLLNSTQTFSIPNTTLNVAGDLTLGNSSSSTSPQLQGSGGAASNLVVGENVLINAGLTVNTTGGLIDATNISQITVGGTWTNNSTRGGSDGFDESTSTVVFNSPAANTLQTIGGLISETFNNLTLNTSAASDVVRINNNTAVSNTLTLTQGELDLNSLTLNVTRNSIAAITRTGGYIKSEDNSSVYGTVQWLTGTLTGSFVYPFGKSSTEFIPFTMNITSAGAPASGSTSVSTYATLLADNLPYPATVTNLNGTSGGVAVVDRFWVITLNGYTTTRPTSTLTFTATLPEIATTGPALDLNAQRWAPSNTWEPALPGQTYNFGAGTVTVPGVNSYSPWALADVSAALPITLNSFSALARNSVVELYWQTEKEINNDYFTLERSTNDLEFEERAIIQGAGNSNEINNYTFVDDSPLPGRSYYRLKQTDYDGTFTYSKVISVSREGKDDDFSAYPNPVLQDEVFLNQEANIIVFNGLNQVVLQLNGVRRFDTSSLPSGIYIIRNQEGKVIRFVKP